MYDRSRYLFSAYFRPFLVISAGIIAGLLLMRLALSNGPKPESALSQPRFSIPNTGSQSNQGGALLAATGLQAVINIGTPGSRHLHQLLLAGKPPGVDDGQYRHRAVYLYQG
jgi:hypothetical protein